MVMVLVTSVLGVAVALCAGDLVVALDADLLTDDGMKFSGFLGLSKPAKRASTLLSFSSILANTTSWSSVSDALNRLLGGSENRDRRDDDMLSEMMQSVLMRMNEFFCHFRVQAKLQDDEKGTGHDEAIGLPVGDGAHKDLHQH